MSAFLSFANAFKLAFGVVCVLPALSSAQEAIQITAQIAQTNHIKLGTQDHWTFQVTCTVWSNQWEIDSRYVRNGLESVYYDGTNVYSRLETVAGNNAKPAAEPRHVTITILPSPGGNPLGNLGVNIPWLAFCSGGYLKIPNRIIPLPVQDIPGTPDSFSFVDKTATFDDEGGLPKSIELLTSRSAFLKSLTDERLYRNPQLLRLRSWGDSKVPDGIVKFWYVVDASTNFNGRIFPTKFRYFDYRAINSTSNFLFVAEGIGTLSSIRQAVVPENVFLTNPIQTVIDGRFRQPDKVLDGIYYTWSKTEVPPTNDPAIQRRLQEMIRGADDIGGPAK